MKFQSKKEFLLRGVQTVQNVTIGKSTLPILSNVLIETLKNGIRMVGTDLDIGVICTADATVTEEGSVTIPGKKFGDIVRDLPDGDIYFSAKKNSVVTIECEKSFFRIMGLPKDEFPKIPDVHDKETFTIDHIVLKEMLRMTSFAICHDETRYVLNGIYMVIEDGRIHLVATDGRRLAIVSREVSLPKGLGKKVIISVKAINEINRILEDTGSVKVAIDNNQIVFHLNDTIIISRLVEGEFPNYENVIPKECKEKIKVDREGFLASCKRVSLLTTHESQSIRIDLMKGKMVISANTPDVGEAREEMDIDHKGGEMSIGFNPNYLIDVLKNMDNKEVVLELTDGEKPGVIRDEGYVYVVLPMQLA